MPTNKKGRDLSRLGLVGSEAAGAAWQSLVSTADLPGERIEGARALPIDLVTPFGGQPRKRFDPDRLQGLADSIREDGVIQPIVVRAHPDEAGRYLIVAGERRWRAAQMAGLISIPAVISEDPDEAATARKMLRENIEREDLDIEDLGTYLQTLVEAGASQRDLAGLTHFSVGKVNALLKLVKYPFLLEMIRNGDLTQEQGVELAKTPEVLEALRRGQVTPAQAYELTRHPDYLDLVRAGTITLQQMVTGLYGATMNPAPAPRPQRLARTTRRNPYRQLEVFANWTTRFKAGKVPPEERAGVREMLHYTIDRLNTMYAALEEDSGAAED